MLALGAASFALAWPLRRLRRLLALLAAAVACAASLPSLPVFSWKLAATAAAALLGVVPFYLEAGGRRPHPHLPIIVAVAVAMPLFLLALPTARYLALSEMRTGAAVVATAAGLLASLAMREILRSV